MRDVKYRTTVRVECPVEKGDDIAAIDEARDAVRVAAESHNHRAASAVIEWEHTDDGIIVFAELSSTTASSITPVMRTGPGAVPS